MKKYNILLYFLLILSIISIYFCIQYLKKRTLVNNIIKEWKKTRKGYSVFKDKSDFIWKNDYYLVFTNEDDFASHIHLKLYNNEYLYKKWYFHFPNFFQLFELYYTPKKKYQYPTKKIDNKKYVIQYKIDLNESPKDIIYEMISNYNKI